MRGYRTIIQLDVSNQMNWTEGMLYPVLHRLERKGLIKSRWAEAENGRKRKYYSVKREGTKVLDKHYQHWSLVNSILAGIRKEHYVQPC